METQGFCFQLSFISAMNTSIPSNRKMTKNRLLRWSHRNYTVCNHNIPGGLELTLSHHAIMQLGPLRQWEGSCAKH